MTDSAPTPPTPSLPYTPAVRAGDWLIVSGQLGVVDGSLALGVEAQARHALTNLRVLLESHGASMAEVVKTTVFLADLDDFVAFNAIYAEAFAPPRPARSAFEVARLPFDARVEIEAWAWLGR